MFQQFYTAKPWMFNLNSQTLHLYYHLESEYGYYRYSWPIYPIVIKPLRLCCLSSASLCTTRTFNQCNSRWCRLKKYSDSAVAGCLSDEEQRLMVLWSGHWESIDFWMWIRPKKLVTWLSEGHEPCVSWDRLLMWWRTMTTWASTWKANTEALNRNYKW